MWTLKITNFRVQVIDEEGVSKREYEVPNAKAEIAEAIVCLNVAANSIPAIDDVLASYSYDLLTELAEEIDVVWSEGDGEGLNLEADVERT